MKEFLLHTKLIRSTVTLAGIFLLFFIIPEDTLSDPVDTLNLQLQWAYPIVVKDMKLVDFDHDGINEILIGYVSIFTCVGIVDAVTKNWLWESEPFNGTIYTVAAGDRDNDGDLDIVAGGQRSDSAIGYIEVFDGPDFDSVHTLSGFDQIVLSAAISAGSMDSLPDIFLGTSYHTDYGGGYTLTSITDGKLYVLNGHDLAVENVSGGGAVRKILLQDINTDAYKELFLGWDYWKSYADYHNPVDYTWISCWMTESAWDHSYGFWLYEVFRQGAQAMWGSFDALEVGSFNGGASFIIGSAHVAANAKLACWNASTADPEWNIEWNLSNKPIVGDLDICGFKLGSIHETNVICVAYQNGLIEFKSGTDGSNLAVILPLHSIYHLKFGNLNQNPWVEMCVASKDSLYVYKTQFLPRNDVPLVSDIPNQTITEGENFTSISLDDYVTDPDDSDSVMVWSHGGETELLVNITDRVATVIPPNPEWNGAQTIWFKACDPGGLCDSNQAIFTVTALNDTPVVSDIPNQTIAEGKSFTSIRLDDYVTDPDDHDSVMVWSHWGETGLLVKITNRVATVTVPNPEWNGAETIWFRACDPGGLCDSNQAIFTVTAVNDAPVVSDIPNQTITQGESFTSISLDDYVTDLDDPDSVMVWSHRGETGLLVNMTNRVATVTIPNPEWNGAETIWFKACDPGGLCDSDEATFTVYPDRFCLFQNYPNPFNPQTNIRFALPVACNVTITIYSILGEKVREFEKRYEAGTHTLMWDGKNSSGKEIASGIYLYKLRAGGYQDTQKMVLIR